MCAAALPLRSGDILRLVLPAFNSIGMSGRDELYAVTRAYGEPPLFHLERAAARMFGVTSYAVHVNGVVGAGGACRRTIRQASILLALAPEGP